LTIVRESIRALADLGSTSSWVTRSQAATGTLALAGDRAGAERQGKDGFGFFPKLRPGTVRGGAWAGGEKPCPPPLRRGAMGRGRRGPRLRSRRRHPHDADVPTQPTGSRSAARRAPR